MSINLRLGTVTRSDGTLSSTSNITAFKVKKFSIDQRYDTKDNGEQFTILITEENGAEHRISLYCPTVNTEVELTPEADRRINGIPQAARGSIVNMVVPNDAIDERVLQNDIDKLKQTRTVCSNGMVTPLD